MVENQLKNVDKRYKIVTFAMADNINQVKEALFSAGAGKIGDYDSCCFETPGTGQFRPLKGSNPTIGSQDKVETVNEVRLELVCEERFLEASIGALRKAHSYEEPAVYITRLESLAFKR